jgi:phosphonate transport system ATP-binding protein
VAPVPLFALADVTKTYGETAALSAVSLSIDPGEHIAIIGPSGAGKSTLVGLLNGTEVPTSGQVLAFGENLNSLCTKARRAVQRRIGTIHQGLHLVDNMRVIHNVNAGHLGRWSAWRAVLSLLRPLEREGARKALERVGIADKLDMPTGRLSGGEQQRVALARVLIQDPQAVLADEPISHLDPERAREIMDLLRDVCLETGKTLVASCHSVAYAKSHFPRVIGLRHGRILFDGPSEALTAERLRDLYRIDPSPASAAGVNKPQREELAVAGRP